jgi:hypothetical protein
MSSVNPRKSSLVDYSKVSSRPDARQSSATATVATAPAAPVAVSAQMDAVIRLMTGREERTIAEKLADSNRPTWEQYKKDNHDKLNLDTLDQKQMDEYRKQLDEERDRRMAGLPARDSTKKDKQRKKIHKKRHRRKYESDGSSAESDISSKAESKSDDESHRRRKHKKRHKYHDKKRKHRSDDDKNGESYERENRKRKNHEKKKNGDINSETVK